MQGPSILRHAMPALALLGIAHAPACRAADAAATISVVTPATPKRWSAAGGDWSLWLVPSSTFGGDAARAARMQRWAAEDRFDPAERLQEALVEALRERGHAAASLTIDRPSEVTPSALARDQLPDAPLPGPIVDVSVESFGLWAASSVVDYRPFVRIGWRLLDARGRVLVPTHALYYSKTMYRELAHARQLEAGEDCRWSTFEQVQTERTRLWGCLDDGVERIADTIAEAVTEAVAGTPRTGAGATPGGAGAP